MPALSRAVVALAIVCTLAVRAEVDPIVDRAYSIELYEGVAIGDAVLTGMGGAGAARIVGSAGALANASAPAVRKTTDNDSWSWDYHLDFLTGKYSSDYDNNGVVAPATSGASLVTFGLALRFGKWAGAITATTQAAPVDGSTLEAATSRGKIVVARWIERWQVSIGLGLQVVTFTLSDAGELFRMTGASTVAGVTWVPRGRSMRAALATESRVIGSEVTAADPTCDPLDCRGFILPEQIEAPGRVIAGFAYRWARTPWNQQVSSRFRDERALTVAADVVITGSTARGHGLEGFGRGELEPTGQSITVSPRAGAELEVLPGRARVRAGSYWEPARFVGTSGRIHATFGAELRALEFRLRGLRRGRLGATFDIARSYRNIGLSVGFWQ